MKEKFDPAPKDKHAEDPKQAQKSDKEMHDKLDKGLEDTFPASDPVAARSRRRPSRMSIDRNGSADRTMLRLGAGRRKTWLSALPQSLSV
jgi:hypothetical protein